MSASKRNRNKVQSEKPKQDVVTNVAPELARATEDKKGKWWYGGIVAPLIVALICWLAFQAYQPSLRLAKRWLYPVPTFYRTVSNFPVPEYRQFVCTPRIPRKTKVRVSIAGAWSEIPREGTCSNPPDPKHHGVGPLGVQPSGEWATSVTLIGCDSHKKLSETPYTLRIHEGKEFTAISEDYAVCVQSPEASRCNAVQVLKDDALKICVVDSRKKQSDECNVAASRRDNSLDACVE